MRGPWCFLTVVPRFLAVVEHFLAAAQVEDFGEEELEQVTAVRVADQVQLVHHHDAERRDVVVVHEPVEQAVRLLDRAHGHVHRGEAPCWDVAAHVSPHAHPCLLEETLWENG